MIHSATRSASMNVQLQGTTFVSQCLWQKLATKIVIPTDVLVAEKMYRQWRINSENIKIYIIKNNTQQTRMVMFINSKTTNAPLQT